MPYRIFVAPVVLGLAASLVGAQTSTTRDSAGIPIVTSTAPSRTGAQALRIGPTPYLVIGGTRPGDPYELSKVVGAARLADGKIVVADGGSLQLRLFDSLGVFIKSGGGRGSGPGEFEQMNRLDHLRGDTLAMAGRSGRTSYFAGLTHLFDLSLTPPAAPPMGPRLRDVIGRFTDGTTLVAAITNPEPRARGARWTAAVPVSLVDRRNTVLRSLGEFPMVEFLMGDSYPQPVWFAAWGSFATADDAFFYGIGTEYSIKMFARDGRLARIIRRKWTPVPVTKADIDTYVIEWGKRWIKSTGAVAEKEREDLRNDGYASTVPAFSQLIADRTGRLWVRTPHLADAPGNGELNTVALVPSVWSVFDREGRWLNDVTLPALFTPYEIGANYVLGRARDADGVETVVSYRLRP